jgi:hypothetical protein
LSNTPIWRQQYGRQRSGIGNMAGCDRIGMQ